MNVKYLFGTSGSGRIGASNTQLLGLGIHSKAPL